MNKTLEDKLSEYDDAIEARLSNPINKMSVRMIFSIKQFIEAISREEDMRISLDASYEEILNDFVEVERRRAIREGAR